MRLPGLGAGILALALPCLAAPRAAEPSSSGPAAAGGAARRPYPPEAFSLARQIEAVALSPDGCLAALSTDITGALELWTVPACGAGGRLREEPGWPRQLSSLDEQVTDVSFSPDGTSVMFASDTGGDERRDLFLVPSPGGVPERLARTPASESEPRFSPDGLRVAYTADPDQPFLFQVFVMDLATRRASQLTREPRNMHRPVWSPDGRLIAATSSGDDQSGDLLLIAASSGPLRRVPPPSEGGMLMARAFSPDGRWVLCTARNQAGFMQLALVPAGPGAGGGARFIGPGDWDVEAAAWREGGIFFAVNENGSTALYRMSSPDSAAELLVEPAGVIHSFDVDAAGRRVAYLWEDSTRPAELRALDIASGARARLTDPVMGGLDPAAMSRGSMISYPSFDGTVINAVYIPPRAPSLGAPPPIVVHAHGGPDWQAFNDFQPIRQALAEHGFAVLAPNFRGSTGYGKRFQDLNNMDWGGGDLQDLASGVKHLAGMGLADPARAGVMGGSYGGYLTLAALAGSSGTWAAGVEWYGMPDLALDYELTGARFADWYRSEMGTPKTHSELYRARSPINFLDRVRAPLLIFQGANDTNVPRRESDLVYAALLERRVPVGLIVYPDEGHGFTRRRNREDHYRRTLEFFLARLGRRAP